jgi:hypothetical protein
MSVVLLDSTLRLLILIVLLLKNSLIATRIDVPSAPNLWDFLSNTVALSEDLKEKRKQVLA